MTKRKNNLSVFLHRTKDHLAQFSEKNGWWAITSTRNVGSVGLRWSEIADFEPIFARSASAVTPSEKVQLTLIGSPLRASSELRWSSYVAAKSSKGGSKTQNGRFLYKIALRLKKVCYKVSLCENCHQKSLRHSLAEITVRKRMMFILDSLESALWTSY